MPMQKALSSNPKVQILKRSSMFTDFFQTVFGKHHEKPLLEWLTENNFVPCDDQLTIFETKVRKVVLDTDGELLEDFPETVSQSAVISQDETELGTHEINSMDSQIINRGYRFLLIGEQYCLIMSRKMPIKYWLYIKKS